MSNTELIKIHYEKLLDSQIIEIAQKDGHALMPEAFQILKDEFKKRNLDESALTAAIEKKAQKYNEQMFVATERNADAYQKSLLNYMLTETENESSDVAIKHGLMKKGLDETSAQEMMESREEVLKKMIDEHDTQMLTGGAVCVIGSIITIWTFTKANEGGGMYVVAWGAIIFGAIRFLKGFGEKRKMNRVLDIANLNKEEVLGAK
jgi:hypothetical protein